MCERVNGSVWTYANVFVYMHECCFVASSVDIHDYCSAGTVREYQVASSGHGGVDRCLQRWKCV